jgi:hypothetical protein
VSPGSPKETFLIGAATHRVGDSIVFEITISPRTTKPTWPFDCSLTTEVGKVEWHISSPCYDPKSKKADAETIKLTIPVSQVPSAVFEFRYYLKVVDTTEIWKIELKSYKDGAEPE